jgi:hypothetical protein
MPSCEDQNRPPILPETMTQGRIESLPRSGSVQQIAGANSGPALGFSAAPIRAAGSSGCGSALIR